MDSDAVTLIKEDHRLLEGLFEQLKAGTGDRRTLVTEIVARFTAHARAEEQEVYPAIAQAAPDGQDEVGHAHHEHHQADHLLRKVVNLIESPHFEQALAEFVTVVGHHVREEEAEVLPALSDAVDDATLRRLGAAFDEARTAELRTAELGTAGLGTAGLGSAGLGSALATPAPQPAAARRTAAPTGRATAAKSAPRSTRTKAAPPAPARTTKKATPSKTAAKSNGGTAAKARPGKAAASKATTSKATASKTTTSKATSSKTAASKATASKAAGGKAAGGRSGGRAVAARSTSNGADGPTRHELYELARTAGIPGRSRMTKEELERALAPRRRPRAARQ